MQCLTSGASFIESAAGQAPCPCSPSATFHAQSVIRILVDTAQEGAIICAGDLSPPSGDTF